jgi:hypothetical protein
MIARAVVGDDDLLVESGRNSGERQSEGRLLVKRGDD